MALEATTALTSPHGDLSINYQQEGHKYQFIKVSYTVDEKITHFTIDEIWVNSQPLRYLKGFKAKLIATERLDNCEIIDEQLYISINSIKNIHLQIFYADQNLDISVDPNLKVSGLKLLLQKHWAITDFTLIDKNGALDEAFTLARCEVQEGAHLFVTKHAQDAIIEVREEPSSTELGEGFGLATFPFVNCREENFLPFNESAPKWRTVIAGLNLEGRCITNTCPAFNERVCIPLGLGTFNINKEQCTSKCTECSQILSDVNNCIFWDCRFSIEGKQTEAQEKFTSGTLYAPNDQALSYKSEGNIVNWHYLEIKTWRPTCWLF